MLQKIQEFFGRNPKLRIAITIFAYLVSCLWIYYTHKWGGVFFITIIWVINIYQAITYRRQQEKIDKKHIDEITNKYSESVEKVEVQINKVIAFKNYLETTNSHTHHSLKNAVDRIDGIIENLEVGNFTEQDLESLKKGTKNLLDALEIVKKFGKSSTQNDFPIGELVDVISVLHKSHTKNIDFQVIYEKVLPSIEISMNWYSAYQVFDNLLINAYEAISNQPQKCIRLFVKQEEDNFLTFLICDTGIGITKEDEDKLFSLGFSTKTSATEKARGIGLNHIQHIVAESNGNISYKGANTDFSTIFELKLPIKQ